MGGEEGGEPLQLVALGSGWTPWASLSSFSVVHGSQHPPGLPKGIPASFTSVQFVDCAKVFVAVVAVAYFFFFLFFGEAALVGGAAAA